MPVGSESREEHRLILLGYLLQSLGVLFGVTAIIGALINHVRCPHLRDPFCRQHCRWQIISFWVALALAATALLTGSGMWLWAALIWFVYRIARGWYALTRHAPPPRW